MPSLKVSADVAYNASYLCLLPGWTVGGGGALPELDSTDRHNSLCCRLSPAPIRGLLTPTLAELFTESWVVLAPLFTIPREAPSSLSWWLVTSLVCLISRKFCKVEKHKGISCWVRRGIISQYQSDLHVYKCDIEIFLSPLSCQPRSKRERETVALSPWRQEALRIVEKLGNVGVGLSATTINHSPLAIVSHLRSTYININDSPSRHPPSTLIFMGGNAAPPPPPLKQYPIVNMNYNISQALTLTNIVWPVNARLRTIPTMGSSYK